MSEKLYIKVDKDNKYIGHPHFASNLQQLYPNHDLSTSPPDGWMEFERVAPPEPDVYETFDSSIGEDISEAFIHNGLEYALVDGKYKDVWHVRAMTAEEKAAKIQRCHDEWNEAHPNITSWVFNEEVCEYEPPVSYPDDGREYSWDESKTNWVVVS